MEDVQQQYQSEVGSAGQTSHKLDGSEVKAIVVPGIVKRGNGELGVGADWSAITVVFKAHVLV